MRTALIYLTSGKVVHMDVSDWECDEEWEYLEEMKFRLSEPRYIMVGNMLVATKHVEAVEFVGEERFELSDGIKFIGSHDDVALYVGSESLGTITVDEINRLQKASLIGI